MSLPTSLGQQPSQSWLVTYGARAVGTVGGLITMILGVLTCISVTPGCIIAGIWLMIGGFIVVSAEAPFCCMFIDFVAQYSKWVDMRPYWQKALLYIIISLPPLFLCFGIALFFGCALLFVTGVLYGLMALGKKAPRQEMMTVAETTAPTFQMTSVLVNNEAPISKF